MTDQLLITAADFAPYKDISENLDPELVNSYINQGQVMDLRPFLGDKLYLLLVSAYDGAVWSDPDLEALFNGEDFAGVRYYGLRPYLVQVAFLRMLSDVSVNVTRAGVRQFGADDLSDAVVQAQINTKVSAARSEALVYKANAEDYLTVKNSTYPTWTGSNEPRKTGFTFFKVP